MKYNIKLYCLFKHLYALVGVRILITKRKNIFFVAFIQKIQVNRLGFFHLCRKAQPQMMLQQVANDVMLRINNVALRANGYALP